MKARLCSECKRPIKGRSDKKFCSDSCRTAYNNNKRAAMDEFVRETNKQLAKNYEVLKYLMSENKIKVLKKTLEVKGFKLDFLTNIYNFDGHTYYATYNFAIEIGKDEMCHIFDIKKILDL